VNAPLPRLVLYGRAACHLCDDVREMLGALLEERAARGLPLPTVEERDVDTDEALQRRYALTIPVVALDGRELALVTSPAKLRRFLAETLGGADTAPGTSGAETGAANSAPGATP
jgi:hypothetical protein